MVKGESFQQTGRGPRKGRGGKGKNEGKGTGKKDEQDKNQEQNNQRSKNHENYDPNRCFYCKEIGHWIKDCPKKKQQENTENMQSLSD